MQLNTLPLLKTLSLAGLLAVATQTHAGTICVGSCTPDPINMTETLHYTYAGYLTDLTVMAEQVLPITLSGFYQSLGIASGAPVAFSAAIDVQHTFNSTGTQSLAYRYSVSFGGISIFGPTSVAYKFGSPFQNDYDSEYDDYGPLDSVGLNTSSFRVDSTDNKVGLRSTSAEDMFSFYGDRFTLSMIDLSAQAFADALPPNNSTLDTLFADGRFTLKGGIQISDESGILLPFGAAKSDVWLNGVFSSGIAPLAPSRNEIQVTPCGDIDLICITPSVPQVPVPGAGILFLSGLSGLFIKRLRSLRRSAV